MSVIRFHGRVQLPFKLSVPYHKVSKNRCHLIGDEITKTVEDRYAEQLYG